MEHPHRIRTGRATPPRFSPPVRTRVGVDHVNQSRVDQTVRSLTVIRPNGHGRDQELLPSYSFSAFQGGREPAVVDVPR